MAKRIVYIIFSLSLILALSFSSFAVMTTGSGGRPYYVDLPEPQPNDSSCYAVFKIKVSKDSYKYYLVFWTLYKLVDSGYTSEDHASGSQSYMITDVGRIGVHMSIDTDAHTVAYQVYDGEAVIKVSNLYGDSGANAGVNCFVQIFDLDSGKYISDHSIDNTLSFSRTWNWDVTEYAIYGNLSIKITGANRYDYISYMPIAWNEAYASKLELDKLDDLNRILGIDSIGDDNSIFNVIQAGFFNQALYFEGLKSALAQSNVHQSNIDNAINGSGKSYADFDKSSINEYDELEQSLNADFSDDLSNIVTGINFDSFSNAFIFWRNKFNSLIVTPSNGIGALLTSFITFALVLGLVIFILGKRG